MRAGAALVAAAMLGGAGAQDKKAAEIKAGGWINSGPISLATSKGKVVALEFWATW